MSGIYFENQKDGLNRSRTYLDPNTTEYGFSNNSSSLVTDKDYYVCWNNLPIFGNDEGDSNTVNTSGTLLNSVLGISTIYTSFTESFNGGSLDCIIVRKSDRKAVRIQVTGITDTTFGSWNGAIYTDVSNSANYPELQRLRLLGII